MRKHHPSCLDICQGLAGLNLLSGIALDRVPRVGLNEVHGEAFSMLAKLVRAGGAAEQIHQNPAG